MRKQPYGRLTGRTADIGLPTLEVATEDRLQRSIAVLAGRLVDADVLVLADVRGHGLGVRAGRRGNRSGPDEREQSSCRDTGDESTHLEDKSLSRGERVRWSPPGASSIATYTCFDACS